MEEKVNGNSSGVHSFEKEKKFWTSSQNVISMRSLLTPEIEIDIGP